MLVPTSVVQEAAVEARETLLPIRLSRKHGSFRLQTVSFFCRLAQRSVLVGVFGEWCILTLSGRLPMFILVLPKLSLRRRGKT